MSTSSAGWRNWRVVSGCWPRSLVNETVPTPLPGPGPRPARRADGAVDLDHGLHARTLHFGPRRGTASDGRRGARHLAPHSQWRTELPLWQSYRSGLATL